MFAHCIGPIRPVKIKDGIKISMTYGFALISTVFIRCGCNEKSKNLLASPFEQTVFLVKFNVFMYFWTPCMYIIKNLLMDHGLVCASATEN